MLKNDFSPVAERSLQSFRDRPAQKHARARRSRSDSPLAFALVALTMAKQMIEITGPLEFLQSRPVVVQPVEQLRVDWMRRLHPALILGLTASEG